MADPLQEYPTELAERLALIENNLHIIVRMDLTREEAMNVKRRIASPIGVLNKAHGFPSDYQIKQELARLKYGIPVDNSR